MGNVRFGRFLGGPSTQPRFRSFGQDLPAVAQEFNAFVRGAHPLHPDFRCESFAIARFGSYFRDGRILLALGGDQASPNFAPFFSSFSFSSSSFFWSLCFPRTRQDIFFFAGVLIPA